MTGLKKMKSWLRNILDIEKSLLSPKTQGNNECVLFLDTLLVDSPDISMDWYFKIVNWRSYNYLEQ